MSRLALKGALGILAIVVFSGAVLNIASADERGHPYSGGHQWDWPGPTHRGLVTSAIENRESLGLTDEQVSKLKAIRNAFRKASARFRADLMEAEEQFQDQMGMDSIAIGEIERISKRIEGLEHELRMAYAKAISDGKSTLTPDQLDNLRELRKKPPGRMK